MAHGKHLKDKKATSAPQKSSDMPELMDASVLDNTQDETIQTPLVADAFEQSPISMGDAALSFEQPRKRKRHIGLKLLLSLVIVLGIAYVAGAIFFTSHFLPRTTMDGRDVSLLTIDEVAQAVQGDMDRYTLDVSGMGINTSINAHDLDLKVDTVSYVQAAHDALSPWVWPYNIASEQLLTPQTPVANFDSDKLSGLLKPLITKHNEKAEKPQDASFAYDEATAVFAVIPEKVGATIDETRVLEQAGESIAQLQSAFELDDEYLVQPAVRADDERLIKAVDDANAILGTSLSLTIRGNEVAHVDGELIKDWISVGLDREATVDVAKVSEWTKGALSIELDRVGTERSYQRPDGKQIHVTGGTYGTTIDGESLANLLAEQLNQKNTEPIDIPTFSESAIIGEYGIQDWGSTYVDVDLSEQHARYYKGGELVWESDVVSGNTSLNYGTPTGVYTLLNRATDQVLIGEIDPKTNKPEYETPVSYWMPFVGNFVGLHDANWRSAFGGDIYVTGGSHGCVNLPPEKAAELFGIISVGDVVVTHY